MREFEGHIDTDHPTLRINDRAAVLTDEMISRVIESNF